VKISLRTKNCDLQQWYVIEELADSEIVLEMEFDQIVSVQSRNEKKTEICEAIQNELSKFEWIVAGSVNVELLWYLHGIERQETDKVGDIDNITKPILDALTGSKGRVGRPSICS
jgi:Holliday junction resolvase RusA-like endonuclease